jgi:cyclophilin family peptidyl-prolyl cis-trans isomerase
MADSRRVVAVAVPAAATTINVHHQETLTPSLSAAGGDDQKDRHRTPRFSLEVTSYEKQPIVVELWPSVAPLAASNFDQLAERRFFDGLTFHRVIKDFMIQGGCPKGNGTGGVSAFASSPSFPDENLASKTISTEGFLLCMANCGPDTNGSQFFITLQPTPWLQGKHTVFGRVVQGQDTVRAISLVRTGADDRPLRPVTIMRVMKLHES